MADQAGFIAKLPGLSSEERSRVMEWGQKRFIRFRCHGGLAGGLFKRQPRSLHALQQLLGKNLANWGIDRENKRDRGWLRLCSKEEFRSNLLGAEISERWRRLAAAALDKSLSRDVRRLNTRRRVIKEKIKQAKQRRMAEAFAALARGVQERKEALEAQRCERTKKFNQERCGLAVELPSYSNGELDECGSWAEVLARRVRHPIGESKERNDAQCLRIELEKAEERAAVQLWRGRSLTGRSATSERL